MNKLSKYILVGLGITSITIASFADATTVSNKDTGMEDLFGFNRQYINGYWDISPATPGTITCAFLNTSANGGTFNDGTNSYSLVGYASYCTDSTTVSITTNFNVETFVITVGEDLRDTFFPQYTSLQCQTAYSLIPISDVTANYCKLNFNLISPTECPESEGTGAVLYTDRYINNVQYPGTRTIRWTIPDDIAYSITYNVDETLAEVEGYNVDEDYINAIIDNEQLTPTNEDFETLINGLIAFIPYLFIGLLFFRFVRIISKIWK